MTPVATAPSPDCHAKSKRVVKQRTEFLREIRSIGTAEGAALVADMLEHEAGEAIPSLMVPAVLKAIHGVGRVQVEAIILGAALARSPHARRVRELHEVERKRLADEVRRVCG